MLEWQSQNHVLSRPSAPSHKNSWVGAVIKNAGKQIMMQRDGPMRRMNGPVDTKIALEYQRL